MIYIVLIFLALSVLMYLLFGGADFGAGILEAFSKKRFKRKGERITYHAIGAVWEANHIWLILVVVILFMGFPRIYSTITTYLHIPLTILLIGIVLRGCSFTFRHYDAIYDHSHRYYSGIFIFSSIFTSLFIGIIAGSLILGEINPDATTFYDLFISPWLNTFCVCMGLFTSCIFSFLAAVYLIGETEEESVRKHLIIQARNVNIATVLSGGLVMFSGQKTNLHLTELIAGNTISIIAFVIATALLPLLWLYLKRSILIPRLIAGLQVTLILFAWFYIQYPVILKLKQKDSLTLYNAVAPEATVAALGYALLAGSLLIIPALLYLLKSFKWEHPEEVH